MVVQPLWNFAAFSVSYPYAQSVGLSGRGISPLQGTYLRTEHKHRIKAHRHPCLESDANHDPSVRAGENWASLRSCGHCDRHDSEHAAINMTVYIYNHILYKAEYADEWVPNSVVCVPTYCIASLMLSCVSWILHVYASEIITPDRVRMGKLNRVTEITWPLNLCVSDSFRHLVGVIRSTQYAVAVN
jgi:hypothetical protein